MSKRDGLYLVFCVLMMFLAFCFGSKYGSNHSPPIVYIRYDNPNLFKAIEAAGVHLTPWQREKIADMIRKERK